ncbi:MAG: putative manganese-dependent inorganic diphosphatase [Bacilli bacterium]|nr:putative manganese-dependent inorganic diphosphatase [Bacilli bacterium]
MERVYVFGHRNPDTDSVCAAITLAYLKRKLGMNAIPAILSSINRETKYALNYFGVKEPIFLNDVKLKVKDLDYSKGYMVPEDASIYEAYEKMSSIGVSKIPVVDKNKQLIGIVGMKDIAEACLNGDYSKIDTYYKNVLLAINGTKVTKYDNEIKGRLIIPGYISTTFINEVKLKENDIIITSDRHSILEYAIKSKVKLIIITNHEEMKPELLKLAKTNKVNIISTKLTTLDTINKFNFCNNVSEIINTTKIHTVCESDDLSSFMASAEKTRYTYYPIIDNNKKCLGIIKYAEVGYHHKKKVILVDHNSYEQSAVGLDEADILEIIDHHNISNIGTKNPINFRNMPLGSSCTIIYLMYKENNIKIPKDMAGLLLSGILSDTLILNSPTTTNIDKDAVNHLSRIAKVSYKKYGFDMISYGTKLVGKTKEEILYNDFKRYPTDSGTIGLGQIFTTNIEDIEKEKNSYLKMLNSVEQVSEYKFVALFVTDIIKNGTYVYFSNGGSEILAKAFNLEEVNEGFYLPNVLSRKMQILPSILDIMN